MQSVYRMQKVSPKVAFVTLASSDYFQGSLRLFTSIRANGQCEDSDFVLLTNSSEAGVYFGDLVDKIVKVQFSPGERIPSSSTVPRFQFTLLKFYCVKVLEDLQYDRIIFVDSDLLCLGALDYLFSPDLNSRDIWAVRDYACQNYYSSEISKMQLDPHLIFNTGCFVVNKSLLREYDYTRLLSEIEVFGQSYDGGDQGYLNELAQRRNMNVGYLPLKFNYPLDVNYPIKISYPAFIHFTGQKPWENLTNVPEWDFWLYRIWKNPKLEHGILKYIPQVRRMHYQLSWTTRSFSLFWHNSCIPMVLKLRNRLLSGC